MIDAVMFAAFIPLFVFIAYKNSKSAFYAYLALSPLFLFIRNVSFSDSVFLAVWQNIYIFILFLVICLKKYSCQITLYKLNIIDFLVWINIFYGLFVFCLTLLYEKSFFIAFKGFRDYYLILFIFFIAKYCLQTNEDIRKALNIMLIISAFASTFTLIENIYLNVFQGTVENLFWLEKSYDFNNPGDYLLGIPIGDADNIGLRFIRPFGIMLHPQINSIFLLFSVMLFQMRAQFYQWPQKPFGLLKALVNVSLFASFGKTALIIYFLITPFLFKIKKFIIAGLVFCVIGYAFFFPFLANFLDMFKMESSYLAATILDINTYLDNNNFLTMLIGHGFDNYDSPATAAEIQFLRLLHYWGIVGTSFYMAPLIYFFCRYIKIRMYLNYQDASIFKLMLAIMSIYWLSTMHYNAFWTNGINTFYVVAIMICSYILQSSPVTCKEGTSCQ